jgi:hypothetical protein
MELGPKDMENKTVVLARRDTGTVMHCKQKKKRGYTVCSSGYAATDTS